MKVSKVQHPADLSSRNSVEFWLPVVTVPCIVEMGVSILFFISLGGKKVNMLTTYKHRISPCLGIWLEHKDDKAQEHKGQDKKKILKNKNKIGLRIVM